MSELEPLTLEDFMGADGLSADDGTDDTFDARTAYATYSGDPGRWAHPLDADGLDPVGQMIAAAGHWWSSAPS